jgi:protein-tyrosine kinase
MVITERHKVQMFAELAEGNRILTGIGNLATRETPFCCVITSAALGEGKTTLTSSLGMIAAKRAGKRILAIDMDWHSPGLHMCFGLVPEWDLEHCSRGKDIKALIRPSGLPNLDILTAPVSSGNGGNFSLENSDLAQSILKQARETYDFILVDTAAVFPTNRCMIDPVVLGSACDAVILVVLIGVTARQQVKRARMMLEDSSGNLAGVVVNHWKYRL